MLAEANSGSRRRRRGGQCSRGRYGSGGLPYYNPQEATGNLRFFVLDVGLNNINNRNRIDIFRRLIIFFCRFVGHRVILLRSPDRLR